MSETLRPVVDIMFGDFLTLVMDQLANQAAKAHYMLAEADGAARPADDARRDAAIGRAAQPEPPCLGRARARSEGRAALDAL